MFRNFERLFIAILLFAAVSTAAADNDKARLVQSSVNSGTPTLFPTVFAVRDTDGLSSQNNNGHRFYIRWKTNIYSGSSLVRTLSKDEPILLPFTWIQLPKHRPPDESCSPDNGESNCNHGTQPYVKVESTMAWDGNDENGDPVPASNLNYRIEAQYIRIKSNNGQLKIIYEINPHCGTFTLDHAPPEITIEGITEGEFRNSNATIQITITDDSGIDEQTITLDGQPFASGGTVSNEGAHILSVFARDVNGRTSALDRHFTIDKTAPQILVTGIQNGGTYSSVTPTITITESNPDISTITLDGNPYASGTPIETPGNHVLNVTALDLAGNVADPVQIQFTISSEPITIQIFFPQENQDYNSDVLPQIQVSGPVLTTSITLNGNSYTEGTPITAEGEYTLIVSATSTTGSVFSQQVLFRIDKTPPEISVDGVEEALFYSEPRTIQVTIQDQRLAENSIELDDALFISGTAVSDEGEHTLRVTAQDHAGNHASKILNFGIDTIPPVVSISTPEDNSVTNFNTVDIAGDVIEQFIRDLKVNGIAAAIGGNHFTADNIALTEGLNSIQVVATDLAGGSAASTIHITLDQTAPGIQITSPANGSQVESSYITVSGTISGSDAVSANVNGIPAVISGTDFTAANVHISPGQNVITATVLDAAGNTQQSLIQVILDEIAPQIIISQPVDGSTTTIASTTVAGMVTDLSSATLAVNGNAVPLQPDGSFQTNLNLSEGPNAITLIALDSSGNSVSASLTVTLDSTGPGVAAINPPDGSTGVPANQLIEILFTEPVASATINNSTVILKTGSNVISGLLQTQQERVTFTPAAPLGGAASYTLTIAGDITDPVGNPLTAPASSTFHTIDNVPPAAPTINPPLPPATSELVITVSGTAEANSLIEVSGGAARATTTASATGAFSAEVSLFQDALNQLSVTSKDLSGNISEPALAAIIQDSVSLVVTAASYEPDGTLFIDFSKPVDPTSITPQNIYLVASGIIQGSLAVAQNPARVVFVPDSSPGANPFLLKVETSVSDQSGNELEYPFTKLFNAGAGGSFVVGEVYDHFTGLPLTGASVRQLAPTQNPAPETTTDQIGQFMLPVSSGEIVLRIEHENYLFVDRKLTVPAGMAAVMFDARLQPVDSAMLQISPSSSTLANANASLFLEVPSGTVTQSAPLQLSRQDGQSLSGLLPKGWSPAAVANISTSTAFQQNVILRAANEHQIPANSVVATALYDSALYIWKGGPAAIVSADGLWLEVETQSTGTIAFLLPDAINAPPAVELNQTLQGAPDPPQPQSSGTPQWSATPEGIYPDQRARVLINFQGTTLQSGTKFQAIVSENYTLMEGQGNVLTSPRTADLIAYSFGQNSSAQIEFYASPARAVDFSQLQSGFINVDIHSFPQSTQQPGIIGAEGGSVSSAEGDLHLTIPAGAMNGQPVPVTLTALGSVGLPLPDYTLVAAFEVNFSSAELALPGVLDAPASLQGNPQLILARLVLIGGASYWIIEGTASYDGNRITTIAGPASLRGIRTSGIYAVFQANIGIGFITGPITDPSGGSSGILITSDATALAALSNSTSQYTLAVPVGSGTARALNQNSGDSGTSGYVIDALNQLANVPISIQVTPPSILSITPAANSTNAPENTAIRITFSESVAPPTVHASSIFLTRSGSIVPGSVLLTTNNTIAVFTPSALLESNAEYTVNITSSITDTAGNPLSNPETNHTFRIRDNTAPSAGNAAFKLFLPEGPDAPVQGTVRFQVPVSEVEPGITIIFFNDTQRTSTSATTQGGFFTAAIAGRITDLYYVDLIDASGNITRVDLPLMEYADGSGAVFTSEGGSYITSEEIGIHIDPGTFSSATPVQVKTYDIEEEDLPPHNDYVPLEHFTLNMNGAEPLHEIEISIPLPSGLNENSQVFVMEPVEFFGERRWMPVEIMKVEGGRLRTQSPPWPAIFNQRLTSGDGYTIAAAASAMYFLQGSVGSLPAVIESTNSDLALYLTDDPDWIFPLPVNENYSLSVIDPFTGSILFDGVPAPPATEQGGIVHLQQPVTSDRTPPYVVSGTPLTFVSWRVGSATGTIRPGITFEATPSNQGVAGTQGTIQVKGDAGSYPDKAYIILRNNRTGVSREVQVTSGNQFTTGPLPYQFGDSLTLLLSSNDVELSGKIRIRFSEPLKTQDYGTFTLYKTDDPTKTVAMSSQLLESNQTLELLPLTNLEADTSYTLEMKAVKDMLQPTPNVAPDFKIKFRTRDYVIAGGGSNGRVNNTFLLKDHLLVGKDTGIEVFSLSNPFEVGSPVGSLSLMGGVRSFARLGSCTINSAQSDECIVVVGGGVQPHGGVLRILDLANPENPAEMISYSLSRYVGDTSDETIPSSYGEGRPIKVLVHRTMAYVATIGIGLQVIDLTSLNQPVFLGPHKTHNEPFLKDVALLMKETPPLDAVLLSGISMHDENVPVSFKALDASDTIKVISKLKSTELAGTSNNIEVFQDLEIDIDQDGRNGAGEDSDDDDIQSTRPDNQNDPRKYEIHDLAFIASGTCGIHVLDITNLSDACVSSEPPACVQKPFLLGTIYIGSGPQNGACSDSIAVHDLKLDRKNRRLYVPAGGAGIYIVDVSDPFLVNTTQAYASQVIGRVELAGGMIADGEVTIDEELNTIYVGTHNGFQSLMTGNIQMYVVTDKNNDDIFEIVGYINSEGIVKHVDDTTWVPGTPLQQLQNEDPVKYFVVALLPSGSGTVPESGGAREVRVRIRSTNLFDHPIEFASGMPQTQIEIPVRYIQPADGNDSRRLYRSDPFFIAAHPLLPSAAKNPDNYPVLAAGNFVKVELIDNLAAIPDDQEADLLRRSIFGAPAVCTDLIDTEKPEPR